MRSIVVALATSFVCLWAAGAEAQTWNPPADSSVARRSGVPATSEVLPTT